MPYPTYDDGMDYTPPDIPTWDDLDEDERAQMLAEEEDFEMEERQEHWTLQAARSLRFLADKLEESEGLEMGRSYGTLNPPIVIVSLADYAGVDQMAKLTGIEAKVGGYNNSYYQVSLDSDYASIDIQTPVITVPRACEYCDQKHDCTHVDGEVA